MKFSGIVKKDQGRGKQLGFPTANLDLPQDVADGIYVGLANNHQALIFIGANITFGESARHAEAYLLDFSGELYGQQIEVELLKKLRENKKFDSQEALIEQMKIDERIAREFFAGSPLSRG